MTVMALKMTSKLKTAPVRIFRTGALKFALKLFGLFADVGKYTAVNVEYVSVYCV